MLNGKTKKVLIGLAAAVSLCAATCTGAQQVKAAEVTETAEVKLSADKITMDTKATASLTLENTTENVLWNCSNTRIATVKGSGNKCVVKSGAEAGTATITARIGALRYTCQLTVKVYQLSQPSLMLSPGNTATITLLGAPKEGITWKVSNKKVSIVGSDSGTIVKVKAGKIEGSATVTATLNKKKYSCKVTVAKALPGSQNLKAVSGSWDSSTGHWVFKPSSGSAKNAWLNVAQKPNQSDQYWVNYFYYHGNLYFDGNGRWDMTKNSKIYFDTTLTVRPNNNGLVPNKGPNVQQAVYKLSPRVKGKPGYYQWFMKGSTKFNDARPIYMVKKPVYIAFGAGNPPYWSIQMSGLKWELADGKGIKQCYGNNNIIGWIGSRAVYYKLGK